MPINNNFFTRLNNCNDEKEWEEKMEKLSTMDPQEILKLEEQKWTRTTPAELYYTPSPRYLRFSISVLGT